MATFERMSAGVYLKMMGAGRPSDRAIADGVARGQTPDGVMNKTEARYAQLLELRKHAGEVKWWKYEAIKLRLADRTFIKVDFFVQLANDDLECHEVKGFMREDAAVKLKVAASVYPFRFYLVRARAKKAGGGFSIVEVARGR